MQETLNGIHVAAVGVASAILNDFEAGDIQSATYPDLAGALDALQQDDDTLLVMTQPSGWSLHRISREIGALIGGHAAIVLSPDGSAFAPGLFVVDGDIPSDRLISLIRRVGEHGPSTLIGHE